MRLLADPKAAAFLDQFTSRWLELYKIGSMPPSPKDFQQYYVDGLGKAMKTEARLFFAHVLENNLPIDRFLDADFTFVNGGLARLYKIPGVHGAEFQKVTLSDRRRGGLLGMAGVLTASANGIDTSPVIRGVWVLNNILGTPPTPPPPDVKPLEPDIRGATTIRDQLAKHRTVTTCNFCHQKIDPPGFALENFDPIGGWRDRYPRPGKVEPPVDASGALSAGEAFTGIESFKAVLSTESSPPICPLPDREAPHLFDGPRIQPADGPQVDKIVAASDHRGGGLRDLVSRSSGAKPSAASSAQSPLDRRLPACPQKKGRYILSRLLPNRARSLYSRWMRIYRPVLIVVSVCEAIDKAAPDKACDQSSRNISPPRSSRVQKQVPARPVGPVISCSMSGNVVRNEVSCRRLARNTD